MKTFEVEVVRTDIYKISVDEAVWTEEEIAKWAESFYPAKTAQDIAEHLSMNIMSLGSNHGFFEGFGYVKMFRPDGSQKNQFKTGFTVVSEEEYTKGLQVILIDEDENFDVNIEEKD